MANETPDVIDVTDLHTHDQVILDRGRSKVTAVVRSLNISPKLTTATVVTEDGDTETIHGKSTPTGIGWRPAPRKT